MRTDDLVAALAANGSAADPRRSELRFGAALAAGAAVALVLALGLLGPRADLAAAAALPMFWIKLALPAAVAAAGWLLLHRLGRPGMPLGRGPAAAAAPVLAVWLLAGLALAAAAPGERLRLLMGSSWLQCPVSVTLLAAPALVCALWALRQLAPTRLRLAGAVAGLFAGGAGAFAYAFHCPEMEAPFLAVWYVAGMLVPAALGAWLGPRLLRW